MPGGLAAMAIAAVACGGFDEAEPSASGVDGGIDASAVDVVADVAVEPADTGGGLEAGDPCADCRSGQCHPDGGCFPLVFVTSDLFAGDLTKDGVDAGYLGLVRADQICGNAARLDGGPPLRFKAWLSTASEAAISRLTNGFPAGAERPVVNTEGKRVADSYLDLVGPDGGLLIAIDRTEGRGLVTDGALVWTGTTAKGLKSPAASAQCLDWKTRDAATGARTGAVGIGTSWTDDSNSQCSKTAHLYCFELVP